MKCLTTEFCFLFVVTLVASLPFLLHEQTSFVDPSSVYMLQKHYKGRQKRHSRPVQIHKFSHENEQEVTNIFKNKNLNGIEKPTNLSEAKIISNNLLFKNLRIKDPKESIEIQNHSIRTSKQEKVEEAKENKYYNITTLKNPEKQPCPPQLTLFAPKWKNKNCRGDINMIWSVAFFTANDGIFSKGTVHNPRQTAADIRVKAMPSLFIADPFLLPKVPLNDVNISQKTATWYMFSEVLDASEQKGKIGLHISHDNMHTFKFKAIIIEEPWHLSFPYVVEENGKHYMTTSGTSGIRSKPYFLWLYQAISFPYRWKKYVRILDGQTESSPVDPALIKHNNIWYLFVRDVNIGENGLERVFFSKNLFSKFHEHPQSRRYNIRQSGRIVFDPDRMIPSWTVFHHTDKMVYGIPIKSLSEHEYEYDLQQSRLILSPLLKTKWANGGMHTLSLVRVGTKKWVGLVDGWRDDKHLAVMGCLGRGQPSWKCQKKARYYFAKFPDDFHAKVPIEESNPLNLEVHASQDGNYTGIN